MHIHVVSADGEAKYWMDPEIELARNYHFSRPDLRKIEAMIVEHEQEICDAWDRHFRS